MSESRTLPTDGSDRRWAPALLKAAAALFVIELAVMQILPAFGLGEGWWEALADSLILAVLAVPALYVVGFRPRAEVRLRDLHGYTGTEKRMLALLVAYVGVLVAIGFLHGYLERKQASNSKVINLAGRQRMLCLSVGLDALHWENSHLEDSDHARAHRAGLDDHAAEFERVLIGLLDGGTEHDLPPCADPIARGKLLEVKALWSTLRAALPPASDLPDLDRVETLEPATDQVLAKSDEVVHRLQVYYEGRARRLEAIQTLSVVATGLIGGLLAVLFVQIIRRRRSLHGELAASRETLEQRVRDRTGELRDVNERLRGEIVERELGHRRLKGLNRLKEELLNLDDHPAKLKSITDTVVSLLHADFARIWLTKPGDRCESGCVHAGVEEGPHVCRFRDRCLHLEASSGRYTHVDGETHRRVPFGCYKIGLVAAGEEPGFATNDVTHDPRVHDHAWARELGLVSFAAQRVISAEGETIGVLALFSKRALSGEDESLLDSLANTTSQVIRVMTAEDELRENHAMVVEALMREKRLAMQLEATMEQLEASNQEAQSANQAKSDFLANMSHEIRTPMTAILGFAENLLHSDLTEAERGDAVRTICSNGEHLLGIINDILDISKIEAGKLEVELIEASPFEIIEQVHSLMQVRAKGRNISLEVAYGFPVPATIRTDPTRLRQILMNLASNAIKFTEAGSVTVRVGFEAEPEPHLRVDMVDTGIGMTPAQVDGLFKPFTQVDTTTTRKFGGTGLGLSISKRLARMLGGEISVTSEPGKGTTVSVTIATGPLEGVEMRYDSRADGPSEVPVEDGGRAADHPLACRILVAEDGPDNQRLIKHILEKAGAEVTVVEDGRLAVEAVLAAEADGNPFDLVLTDIQMPVMDGYEATRTLRGRGYEGPIVALTAHATTADREKCLNAGCDDYLTKPIRRAIFVKTIANQLAQRQVVVG